MDDERLEKRFLSLIYFGLAIMTLVTLGYRLTESGG